MNVAFIVTYYVRLYIPQTYPLNRIPMTNGHWVRCIYPVKLHIDTTGFVVIKQYNCMQIKQSPRWNPYLYSKKNAFIIWGFLNDKKNNTYNMNHIKPKCQYNLLLKSRNNTKKYFIEENNTGPNLQITCIWQIK